MLIMDLPGRCLLLLTPTNAPDRERLTETQSLPLLRGLDVLIQAFLQKLQRFIGSTRFLQRVT